MKQRASGTVCIGGGGVGGMFAASALVGLPTLTNLNFIGTSVGAILAGLYAIGMSPLNIALSFPNIAKAIFGDGASIGGGIITTSYDIKALRDLLTPLFGRIKFADCPYPLAVVASKAKDAAPLIIEDGSVLDAVLASSAAPSYLDAFNGLVDGGLVANLPATQAWLRWRKPILAIANGGGYEHDLSEDWDISKAADVIQFMMSGQIQLNLMTAAEIAGPNNIELLSHDTVFELDSLEAVPALRQLGAGYRDRVSTWYKKITPSGEKGGAT